MAFPISKNKIQCISKCVEKNTVIQHPITQQSVTNTFAPFCAVTPFEKNNKTVIIDECDLSTDQITSEITETPDQFTQKEDILETLYPLFVFNIEEFLKTYYNINDLSDFYDWFKNNKSSAVFTKIRILDCGFQIFGSKISIIEDILTQSIIEIIRSFWIKKLYGKLCKYLDVKDDKVIVVKSSKLSKTEQIPLRSKFIITDIITQANIFEITNKYINILKERVNVGTDDYLVFLTNALIKKIVVS